MKQLRHAASAFMRDIQQHVPEGCMAFHSTEENERALAEMRYVLDADNTTSPLLDLQDRLGKS